MDNKLFSWVNSEAEKREWNYSEVARRAGISHSSLSLVLSGQRNITFDFCAAVAKAFGERPEKVFRIAGLLPPSSGAMEDLSADEAELVEIYRALQPAVREYALRMLRGLPDG